MDDCISRQAVLELIEHYNSECLVSVFVDYENGKKLDTAVRSLPSVTPTERTGHWIYQNDNIPYKWKCDQCSAEFKTDFNYCPNCGAKMQEVEE